MALLNDRRQASWELVEDVPFLANQKLELRAFLREALSVDTAPQMETCVSGEEMLTRARGFGNRAGQQHAEALLVNSQSIPESWRQFILVFPGTLWRDPLGLGVPVLRWTLESEDNKVEKWVLCFVWLGFSGYTGDSDKNKIWWGPRHRLVLTT